MILNKIKMQDMKKIICLLMVILAISSVNAQKLYDDNFKKNRFAIDLGIGSAKGANGIFDLGVRYQKNFLPYLSWDAIGIKAMVDTDYFDELWTHTLLQAMTGVRGTSPCFYKNMSGYVALDAGYGYHIENDYGGVCCEFNLGLNLCKNVYVGYALNFQKANVETYVMGEVYSNDMKAKTHSLRIGFIF